MSGIMEESVVVSCCACKGRKFLSDKDKQMNQKCPYCDGSGVHKYKKNVVAGDFR